MNFREVIYAACLKAAKEIGPDIRGLSWFYKNNLTKPKE